MFIVVVILVIMVITINLNQILFRGVNMALKYAHLSASFILTSIIGFFISIYFVTKFSETWAFTFAVFFAIMFISSIISMTKADFTDKELQEELAIHEKVAKKKWKKTK